jgi:hypothetical protein
MAKTPVPNHALTVILFFVALIVILLLVYFGADGR